MATFKAVSLTASLFVIQWKTFFLASDQYPIKFGLLSTAKVSSQGKDSASDTSWSRPADIDGCRGVELKGVWIHRCGDRGPDSSEANRAPRTIRGLGMEASTALGVDEGSPEHTRVGWGEGVYTPCTEMFRISLRRGSGSSPSNFKLTKMPWMARSSIVVAEWTM